MSQNTNNYSRLYVDYTKTPIANTWKDIQLSGTTKKQRQQFDANLDDFATFMWRGIDAWEVFGAFIIADKQGDLKFYNGPSFSNEYTNPQYESSSGNLTGVTFKQQTIKFKVGVYWISIEDYRKFINWLDPHEINYLSFGFNKKYSYLVKLSGISDSPKYVVGNEMNGTTKVPQFYTELDLTWEVQGASIARSNTPFEFDWSNEQDGSNRVYTGTIRSSSEVVNTDLKTPLTLQIPVTVTDNNLQIECKVKYNETVAEATLFNISLQNLTYLNTSDLSYYHLNLEYDSETGLLFLNSGDDKRHLLSLTTTTSGGENIVKTLTTKKFFIPGRFDTEYVFSYLKFIVTVKANDNVVTTPILTAYARTNIL